MAPVLGLVVESLIPLLLLFIPNLGVVLALAFHSFIPNLGVVLALAFHSFIPNLGVMLALAFHSLVLLTPAPNYAGGFSVSCACRLLLALPNLEQAASVQLFSRAGVIAGAVSSALVPSATFGAFAAIGAALLTALVPNLDLKAILPNLDRTAFLPNLDRTALLRGRIASQRMQLPLAAEPNLEADPNLGARRLMHAASYATALYAFVLPVLGLLHMGSSSM